MDYMNHVLTSWPIVLTPWKIIGYTGAALFASRWLVQLYYSRKAGRPVTPRMFWIMSVVGSLMTLAYFSLSNKQDSVGVLQNLFPAAVALYNLYLEVTHSRKTREAALAEAAALKAAEKPVSAPEVAAANK